MGVVMGQARVERAVSVDGMDCEQHVSAQAGWAGGVEPRATEVEGASPAAGEAT